MSIVSIPRISDNYLVKVFVDDVLQNYSDYDLPINTNVSIRCSGTTMTVTLSKQESGNGVDISCTQNKILNSLREYPSNIIESISLTEPLPPQQRQQQHTLVYKRSPSSLIDTLDFNTLQKTEDFTLTQQKISNKLTRYTNTLTPNNNIESNTFAAHHEVLTKLEGFNASLIEKQHEYINQLDIEKNNAVESERCKYEEKSSVLEAEFTRKSESLELVHEEKNDKLKAREQAVSDADNTTARRNTTTSMLTSVQKKAEQFNFSSSVNKRSVVTIILCLLLMILAAVNSYSALSELEALNYLNTTGKELRPTAEKPLEILWFLYVRIFLGSVLFITSTLYLIKWMNSWTDRIAQQELDNQKFVRDLNRSHLTIEMCLEWNDNKDGPIPEQLLAAMTEGLFKDKVQANTQINHPIDQLASALVKSADKIEFPLGNGTVTTSGKNVSKAKAAKQDIPKENKVA